MIRALPARTALVLAYMALILTFTIMPGDDLSRLGFGRFLVDLGHVPLFAGLALVTFWATAGPLAMRLLAAALLCVMFAGIGEWLQHFVPRRVPTFDDFRSDCIGIALGLAIALGISLLAIPLNLMRPPSGGGASR